MEYRPLGRTGVQVSPLCLGCMNFGWGAEEEDSIRVVLLTAPGERLMRPQFGCRIWDLMFEPVNANLLGLISEAVRDALAQWEPRIEVEDVTPEQDEESSGVVQIRIAYRVRATNNRRNLVYPFYVIPREDA